MKTVLASMGTLLCLVITARGADVAELIKQLKSSDPDTRRSAAVGLGEYGAAAKPAVPALTAALKDRDMFVRRFSAKALGAIGPDASSAIGALKTSLNDARTEVQSAAADALGRLGPEGIDVLIGVVKDGEAETALRSRAISTLANIGPPAHGAVSALVDLAQSAPNPPGGKKKKKMPAANLRIDALTALGALANSQDTTAIEALTAMTDKDKEKNGNIRRIAKMELQKIKRRK